MCVCERKFFKLFFYFQQNHQNRTKTPKTACASKMSDPFYFPSAGGSCAFSSSLEAGCPLLQVIQISLGLWCLVQNVRNACKASGCSSTFRPSLGQNNNVWLFECLKLETQRKHTQTASENFHLNFHRFIKTLNIIREKKETACSHLNERKE